MDESGGELVRCGPIPVEARCGKKSDAMRKRSVVEGHALSSRLSFLALLSVIMTRAAIDALKGDEFHNSIITSAYKYC